MLLSKSTFVRGYDCPVRIRHAADRLASSREDDEFLEMLAVGGFQFEFLVRHAWPGTSIRGDLRDPRGAHARTVAEVRRLLAAGGGVLHEGTLFHSGCYARIDTIRVTPGTAELCEIKAKSFDGPADPELGRQVVDGAAQLIGKQGVRSEWLRYVVDVGYQAWVAERALAAEGLGSLKVHPRLVVVNKNAACGQFDSFDNVVIDAARGMAAKDMTADCFRWVREPPAGYRSPLIIEVDVAAAVGRLRAGPSKSKARRWRMSPLDAVAEQAAAIAAGTEVPDPAEERGLKCRDCEFRAADEARPESGFERCWRDHAAQAAELLTLYYGSGYKPGSGPASAASPRSGGPDWVALTVDGVPPQSARIASLPVDAGDGSRAATRNMQIEAERSGTVQLAPDFRDEVRRSLMCGGAATRVHFIDFETTMACLPLAAGMRAYEVVAFQFSCHSAGFDGRSASLAGCEHRQFLNRRLGAPASVLEDDRPFVDALRECLSEDATPVFHWAAHERTVLRKIRSRLDACPGGQADANDASRIGFLDGLLGADGRAGRLVDMRTVAEGGIMAPGQCGRYSMKRLLPAICREPGIRALVWSLMDGTLGDMPPPGGAEQDPYKLLPPLPGAIVRASDGDEAEEDFDQGSGPDGIRCGTDAMRAFQQLRFSPVARWGYVDRAGLIAAMEAYCKLDTAAMVAVWSWMVRMVGKGA